MSNMTTKIKHSIRRAKKRNALAKEDRTHPKYRKKVIPGKRRDDPDGDYALLDEWLTRDSNSYVVPLEREE